LPQRWVARLNLPATPLYPRFIVTFCALPLLLPTTGCHIYCYTTLRLHPHHLVCTDHLIIIWRTCFFST
jgi:hypothetical protein